ncbi:hypothetical protein [Legionella sp.]|uniref:hypothetical protein n=1 Tax=Legionella sp. TaxID=459 RepID=UPI000CAE8EED|nr:hypothetical protein [Legionella sp.]PJE09592.1 MAG: hypothetical protein CK430_11125 [Legionella sp.]
MRKNLDIAILQHLNQYQKNSTNNYNNRYFLLKSMLMTSLKCPGEEIDKTRYQLKNAGLIGESHKGLLYITDSGTQFLYEKNKMQLRGLFEKISPYIPALLLLIETIKDFCQIFF